MLANPDKSLFFFDEARFGTHSKIGHGWFKRGAKTPVKVKLGFQNFYLYSAVNPNTGMDFTLIAPNANTVCFNIYLEEFGKFLGETEAVFVLDGAGWHKSKDLIVPDNITLIFLPPYSPELNPVERLWKFIKGNTIKNKVFESLGDLEQAICSFIQTITPNTYSSICNIDYL